MNFMCEKRPVPEQKATPRYVFEAAVTSEFNVDSPRVDGCCIRHPSLHDLHILTRNALHPISFSLLFRGKEMYSSGEGELCHTHHLIHDAVRWH